MANITPKIEILVDLTRPVEEIQACIAAIANSNPGKQLEILKQVDLWMGESINKIEEQQAAAKTDKKDEPPNAPK